MDRRLFLFAPLAFALVGAPVAPGLSLNPQDAPLPPTREQPELASTLDAALRHARDVRARTNSPEAATDALTDAIRRIIAEIDLATNPTPAANDVAQTLRRTLDDARSIEDPGIRLGRMNVGVTEARAAATFRPIMEAELPEGFPPPGPVGQVVVKDYPAYRAARTSMTDNMRGQNTAFNRLFRHITTHDVKMTAPVEMVYDPSRQQAISMAFLYERPNQGATGEKPGNVEVVDLPAVTVASIGLRGAESRTRIEAAEQQLRAWLASPAGAGYEVAGPLRYMGYNSPFVLPYLRFSEVQLPIRPKPIR